MTGHKEGPRPSTRCVRAVTVPPGRKPFLGAGYMNPSPPDLAKIAPERSPQELFWVIKHGLRMTGMPAWGPTHGDEQLWDLVAMVVLPGFSRHAATPNGG
jgi:mono/diheme cytochrome c family protein